MTHKVILAYCEGTGYLKGYEVLIKHACLKKEQGVTSYQSYLQLKHSERFSSVALETTSRKN